MPTTLGGVQAMINRAAVPIAFASFYRVAVPALYTNQPGGGGRITAVNANGTMNSSALPADKEA
jgi:hypothetical protein